MSGSPRAQTAESDPPKEDDSKPRVPRKPILLVVAIVIVVLGFTVVIKTVPCLTVSYAGEGTAENPYEVSNVNQLQCMNQNLNAHYEQVSDIDASETTSWNDGRGFLPVGPVRAFNGTYNGAGYNIMNLSINRKTSSMERPSRVFIGEKEDGVGVGLFGVIGSQGKVTNVSLVNANIVGDTSVGVLAGQNRGTVSKSYATGKVNGREFVGGLVGSNIGTDPDSPAVIEKSYSVVDVDGVEPVGGLASENSGLGGNATITETYVGGNIKGEELSGLVHVGAEPVTHSYWDVNATGQNSSGAGTGLTTEQMTGEAARGNMTGFDFDDTWETVPDGYPRPIKDK